MIEAALQAQDGQQIAIPDYDFINFQRLTLSGGRSFVMRPIVIIDGMIPYPKANVVVLLTAPDAERRRRIIARDKLWKTQVIRFWDQHQRTLAYLKSLPVRFDLVLDGLLPAEQNAKRVLAFLTFVLKTV